MDLDFYKLQTAGNDLILINFAEGAFPGKEKLKKLAAQICRRDYGIGSNGLIAIKKLSPDKITAYFADPTGNLPEAATDAAFCLCRYIFDSGITGNSDFKIEINGRTHRIGVIDSNNFRLSLGTPLDENGSELIEHPDREYIKNITADGEVFPVSEIFVQKKGVVVFSSDESTVNLKDKADRLLRSVQIDNLTRLIFATVYSRDELEVHIRNSRCDDFSSSCAIAAAAAVVNGFLDREAVISHKRGEYFFQWLHPSNEIFLTGSADYVFSGSIFIDL